MSATVLIIADPGAERFRTALVLACAQAALGKPVRMFLQGSAIELIRHPVPDPDAARQTAAGLPTLGQLLDEALKLEVVIEACQSSMAVIGAETTDFDSRIAWGGMIGLLSRVTAHDRLLVV